MVTYFSALKIGVAITGSPTCTSIRHVSLIPVPKFATDSLWEVANLETLWRNEAQGSLKFMANDHLYYWMNFSVIFSENLEVPENVAISFISDSIISKRFMRICASQCFFFFLGNLSLVVLISSTLIVTAIWDWQPTKRISGSSLNYVPPDSEMNLL